MIQMVAFLSAEKRTINTNFDTHYSVIYSFLAPNLALKKPAWQYNNWQSYSTASKAVDGNEDGRLTAKSCQCTQRVKNAWWAVDLGNIYNVKEVRIANRAETAYCE